MKGINILFMEDNETLIESIIPTHKKVGIQGCVKSRLVINPEK